MISHEPPKIISNKERIHLSYSMRHDATQQNEVIIFLMLHLYRNISEGIIISTNDKDVQM
jgi:hypothetical protein